MDKNIIKVDYTDEMEQSYIDYAMSVIVQRALPDIRDGLKPVHRRILYAMNELNLNPNSAFKKSARIVGDVLGKYHPHGDSSVYNAMVRLAQDFNTNHILVKGQGNFGSIDGDSAAAMRYTEAKLTDLSVNMLEGLNKNIVEFHDNFDNSLKEPEILPAKFFNLLINGSTGIAVGMSTNIPPHNLNEVNNATKAFLNDRDISTKGLMKYIKGPDFPTGGEIINKDELYEIYNTGTGRIKVRAVFEVEELKGGRKNLVITEIPYSFSGNKTRLLESIIELVNNRKLDELTDVRDESSKDGIRIVLEVKKGIDIEKFKLKLFQNTKLEDTVAVNLLSIVDKTPMVLSLREMFQIYTDFLIDLYKKEFNFELNKLNKDREIKEGLVRAYDIIDLIIEIIRGSKSKEDVLNCLVSGNTDNIVFKSTKSKKEASKLDFSKIQAESIMKMQLQQLVGLELDKLNIELESTLKSIAYYKELLNNDEKLNQFIISELDNLKKKQGRNRKTKINQIAEEDIYVEEEIIEDLYALIDRFNYVKIIDEQSYTRTNEETLESFEHIISIKSNDNLCIFSDDSKFYQFKIEEFPISKMKDRGTPLPNGIEILLVNSKEYLMESELFFSTKLGMVKRVDFSEFDTNRREIIASKLKKDDSLLNVEIITEDKTEVVMLTKNKRQIRFNIDEVSNLTKNTIGVIGINLNQGDYVLESALDITTDEDKRRRGAKGSIVNYKTLSFLDDKNE